ncbi:SH3 domain-containing protein [Qingshengfaniella alkalisoli]|uniref:SH3 domain-containing protein n=1 Tax=Qingshengfaniella alkalisoli TaxID=2599296 RepID=A0A5B8J5Q4_9RHOB|nr:SH3 domain-containing protein [Qingshengfaniella alkalisoli]QDY69660.1 SH3 domain-containing protein [Qingshengfaniella alkalisoli]
MNRRQLCAILGAFICIGTTPSGAAQQSVGPVTNLPIPRFVSLKASNANVRRGPSLNHRVDWVFQHQGMPLIVTGEYGHWRQVRDRDGLGGWVHYAMLSGVRTAIVDVNGAEIHARPATDTPIRATAENGVILRVDECEGGWCQVSADGHKGWMQQGQLWGVLLSDALPEQVAN